MIRNFVSEDKYETTENMKESILKKSHIIVQNVTRDSELKDHERIRMGERSCNCLLDKLTAANFQLQLKSSRNVHAKSRLKNIHQYFQIFSGMRNTNYSSKERV